MSQEYKGFTIPAYTDVDNAVSHFTNFTDDLSTALAAKVNNAPSADQTITAQSATVTPLIVKGADSQSDPAIEVQKSDATATFRVFDTGQVYAGGGMYPLPFRMAAGKSAISGGVTAVTMPSGRFTVAPIVTAVPEFPGAASNAFFAVVLLSGSTSVSLYGIKNDGTLVTTAFDMYWTAVQMTSSTAGG